MAVGEEPDMADAMKAVRHGMQQEPPHEFARRQRHHLGLGVMAVVLPGEADLVVGEPGQPAIGDGDAVGVAAQIGQHLLGPRKRALGIDDPFGAAQSPEASGEGCRFGQRRKRAGEAQFAGLERRKQPFGEQRAEPAGEHPHRQEEPRPTSDPSCLVRRQAATRHDAVQVRVVLQGLAPRVQHGDRADLGTEVTGVGGDLV